MSASPADCRPTDETTDDAFLGGRLNLLQPAKAYRAGMDAILLAASAPLSSGTGARVLDIGAGVGAAGLALAKRIDDARVVLAEIDPRLVALASTNIRRNGLDDRCRVIEIDVSKGGAAVHELAARQDLASDCHPGRFTHAIANPPYFAEADGTPPTDETRARAHQMPQGGIERWMAFAATALCHGGYLSVIHRADALAALLAALGGRFGAVRIRPIHSRPNLPAKAVILEARKGVRTPLALLPALVTHDSDGAFTPDVEATLRHGAALPPVEAG